MLFRALVVCSLVSAAALMAQRDLTVQWKVSLEDLNRRLTGLTGESGADVDELRFDTESLRSSIALFAIANPGLKIEIPAALPNFSSRQDLTDQVKQLNAVVKDVIEHTPGTAFNLGHVGNTSISILPTLPKNKMVGAITVRLPHQILAICNERYESGLTLQNTTYAATSPLFLPYSESYASTDIMAIVPIHCGIVLQGGVKNLLDRNYYYTAGYPEEGRNWVLNVRYHSSKLRQKSFAGHGPAPLGVYIS